MNEEWSVCLFEDVEEIDGGATFRGNVTNDRLELSFLKRIELRVLETVRILKKLVRTNRKRT